MEAGDFVIHPLGASGSRRSRSVGRDSAFGTPPDYVSASPPQDLTHRGRQRARTVSPAREQNVRFGNQPAEPRSPDYHSHLRSTSQPRGSSHHHRHRHRHRDRDPSPSFTSATSPPRPTYSRTRSRSLPASQNAYHYQQAYYYPPTAANPMVPVYATTGSSSSHRTRAHHGVAPVGSRVAAYGTQPILPLSSTASESRNPFAGLFPRLFGRKERHHNARHPGVQIYGSAQPTQSYAGYGAPMASGSGAQAISYTHPSTYRQR